MTHAVVALDVDIGDQGDALPFAGTALKFSPHITLLPRTILRDSLTEQAFARRFAGLAGALLPPIQLVGPISVNTDLIWYECTPRSEAFRNLLDLHTRVLRLVSEEDCVMKAFTGLNYRPHLTVFWNGRAKTDNLPPTLIAYPRGISVYSYSGDPKLGVVRQTRILPPSHGKR